MKIHSCSLIDESLRTTMVEAELIINSRPLTVETISDSESEIALSSSNLRTMKIVLWHHINVRHWSDCEIIIFV